MVYKLTVDDFRRIVNVREARKNCKGKEIRNGLANDGHGKCGSCPGNYYDGGECNFGGKHRLSDDLTQINRNFEGFEKLVSRHACLKRTKNESEFDKEKQELISAFETMQNRCEKADGFMYGSCVGIEGNRVSFQSQIKSRFQIFARELRGWINKVKQVSYQQFAEFKMKIEKLEQMKAEAAKLGEDIKNEKDPVKKQQLIAALNSLQDNIIDLRNEIQNHHCADIFDKNITEFLNNVLENIVKGKGDVNFPNNKGTTIKNRSSRNNRNSQTNAGKNNNNQTNNNAISPQTKDKLKTAGIIVGCLALLVICYFLIKSKLES